MNKTRHSGVQVRTSSLKSKRQTLRHAWCVWSRDLCVIRVPVCAHKFLVGVYRCEYVHMCVRVPGCTKSLLHHLLHHKHQVSPARARPPFLLPTPSAACSTRPALGLRWAGLRRPEAGPPPHHTPVAGYQPLFSPRTQEECDAKGHPAGKALKALSILLAGRTPVRAQHSPPPWAPPRALCPVGHGH